jgi:hypothetical protein
MKLHSVIHPIGLVFASIVALIFVICLVRYLRFRCRNIPAPDETLRSMLTGYLRRHMDDLMTIEPSVLADDPLPESISLGVIPCDLEILVFTRSPFEKVVQSVTNAMCWIPGYQLIKSYGSQEDGCHVRRLIVSLDGYSGTYGIVVCTCQTPHCFRIRIGRIVSVS